MAFDFALSLHCMCSCGGCKALRLNIIGHWILGVKRVEALYYPVCTKHLNSSVICLFCYTHPTTLDSGVCSGDEAMAKAD